MKRIFKILMVFLFLTMLFGILFIFWAKSSSLSEKESSVVTTNNVTTPIVNDSIYSIMTYNIGHLSGLYTDTSAKSPLFYEDNFNESSKLFKAINPSIIAFQDIDFNSSRSYKTNQSQEFAKLGYNYIAEAVYWDKNYIPAPYWPLSKQTGKVVSGQSIISRLPIESQERIVLENELNLPFYKKIFRQDRIAQIVKLKIDNKIVVLINVHLEDASKSARVTQFNYVLNLFNEYSKNHPTILLGDFNSSIKKSEAFVHKLLEMQDIGHSVYKNLDYIFYNKRSIDMVSSKVLDEFTGIANHLPILMHFKLK